MNCTMTASISPGLTCPALATHTHTRMGISRCQDARAWITVKTHEPVMPSKIRRSRGPCLPSLIFTVRPRPLKDNNMSPYTYGLRETGDDTLLAAWPVPAPAPAPLPAAAAAPAAPFGSAAGVGAISICTALSSTFVSGAAMVSAIDRLVVARVKKEMIMNEGTQAGCCPLSRLSRVCALRGDCRKRCSGNRCNLSLAVRSDPLIEFGILLEINVAHFVCLCHSHVQGRQHVDVASSW